MQKGRKVQAVETVARFSYIGGMHIRDSMRDAIAVAAFIAASVFIPPHTLHAQPARSPLARAGSVYITEDEFIRRFELLPAFGRHRRSQLDEAKAELLYSMIAEKLLAQEAASQGLDREPRVVSAVEEVRKLLARDELYRREVINAVRIDPRDVVRGVIQARRRLSVGYIYTPDEASARFIRGRVGAHREFWALVLDPSLHAERDTVTVAWGEANAAIEQAAYRLKKGEVSPVLAAGKGFYLLTLDGEQPNEAMAGMPSDALTEKVRTTLRRRKEQVRLDAYMDTALKDRTGYAIARTLRALAGACARVTGDSPPDSILPVSPGQFAALRAACGPALRDSLAVVDTTVWSVGDVLDRLATKNLSLPAQNPGRIMAVLDDQIRVMVQQELLAREALRRGLDTAAAVSNRVTLWKQYLLAERMKDLLKATVRVTDAEAWSYLRSMDTGAPVPRIRIRELRTASLEAIGAALADLERGMSLAEVIAARSIDTAARNTGGVSAWFPITDRTPIGEIAWSMRPGERFGPVNVPGGYSYFELLEKRSRPAKEDSALDVRLADARRAMLRLKQNRRVSLFLAQSGDERGFEVYEDRLKSLPVSPVPMMTFRILGFGGRMFEVPFVDKQIEWLGIAPPSSKILP